MTAGGKYQQFAHLGEARRFILSRLVASINNVAIAFARSSASDLSIENSYKQNLSGNKSKTNYTDAGNSATLLQISCAAKQY